MRSHWNAEFYVKSHWKVIFVLCNTHINGHQKTLVGENYTISCTMHSKCAVRYVCNMTMFSLQCFIFSIRSTRMKSAIKFICNFKSNDLMLGFIYHTYCDQSLIKGNFNNIFALFVTFFLEHTEIPRNSDVYMMRKRCSNKWDA